MGSYTKFANLLSDTLNFRKAIRIVHCSPLHKDKLQDKVNNSTELFSK